MLFSFPKGLWVKLFFGNCVTRSNLGAYGFLEGTGLTGNNSFQKESSCLLFPKAPFNQILNTKTCRGLCWPPTHPITISNEMHYESEVLCFSHSGEQALRDLKKRKKKGVVKNSDRYPLTANHQLSCEAGRRHE